MREHDIAQYWMIAQIGATAPIEIGLFSFQPSEAVSSRVQHQEGMQHNMLQINLDNKHLTETDIYTSFGQGCRMCK